MAHQEISGTGLSLAGVFVQNCSLNMDNLYSDSIKFNIESNLQENPENKFNFHVVFELKIFEAKESDENIPSESDCALFVRMIGDFFSSEDTEDNRLKNFKLNSSPMILFPYLRAFVSNLTNSAGRPPITLPSIFIQLKEDNPQQ